MNNINDTKFTRFSPRPSSIEKNTKSISCEERKRHDERILHEMQKLDNECILKNYYGSDTVQLMKVTDKVDALNKIRDHERKIGDRNRKKLGLKRKAASKKEIDKSLKKIMDHERKINSRAGT